MKKIVLVLLAVLLIPTHAFAYTFSVKVVNKTGGKLWVIDQVKINVKGSTIREAEKNAAKKVLTLLDAK